VIQLPKGVKLQDLTRELAEELATAEIFLKPLKTQLYEWERLYLAKPKQKERNFPWRRASNIVVPIIGTFTDALFARHMNTIFGGISIWTVEPLSKAWIPVAKLWEKFIENESYRTFRLYKASVDWLLSAVKFGLGVLRVTWEDSPAKIMTPEGPRVVPGYTGPKLTPIPLAKCLWPEDATSVEDARWFAREYWVAERTFELGAKVGYYTLPKNATVSTFLEGYLPEEDELLRKEKTGQSSSNRGVRGVKLTEVSWTIDIDDDGVEEEVLAVFHKATETILRLVICPFYHGKRPFIGVRYWPVEGSVMGLGVCSMLEQIAEAISTVHNQATDNATIANTRIWAVRPGTPMASPDYPIYPGAKIITPDPAADIVPKQLGEVYPSITEREAIYRDYAERRVGVTDYSLGRESPIVGWRATATSTVSLLQEASRRFDLTLREIRDAYRELGTQITELYQQFKPVVVLREFAEDKANIIETVINLPPERVRLGLDINLTAITAARNAEAEKQNLLNLFGLLKDYYASAVQAAMLLENPETGPISKGAAVAALQKSSELMRRLIETWTIPDAETFVMAMQDVMESANAIRNTMEQAQPGSVVPIQRGR
jgi:hypothetical protein